MADPVLVSIESLVAVQEIRQLKARYWRCIDLKLWDELSDGVFAPDLQADYTGTGGGTYASAAETVTMLSSVLGDAVTAHSGGEPEIDLIDATTASGIWSFQDRLVWPHGILTGAGHYHESYRRTEHGWRIAVSRITRLWEEFEPIEPIEPPSVANDDR